MMHNAKHVSLEEIKFVKSFQEICYNLLIVKCLIKNLQTLL